MATICKPQEPLLLCGSVSQNRKDFEEQLSWFLAGTESSDKSDMVKIGIMLSHAGKEAREVYKHYSGPRKGTIRETLIQKLDKLQEGHLKKGGV